MLLHTISWLDNANTRGELGEFSSSQVAVFFTGVVTSVKNLNTDNIHDEHGGTKYMASGIAPEAYPINFQGLVEIYDLKQEALSNLVGDSMILSTSESPTDNPFSLDAIILCPLLQLQEQWTQ